MSQTLESFHLNVVKKLQTFRDLVDILTTIIDSNDIIGDIDDISFADDDIKYNSPRSSDNSNTATLKKEKTQEILERVLFIEDIYNSNTTDCFNNYYLDIDAKEAEITYFLNLTTINIESKIRELSTQCQGAIAFLNLASNSKVFKLLNELDNIHISIPVEPINYEVCCQTKMETFSNASQLYCAKCGKMVDIKGMVFEDAQFYSQEGKKTKHGRYDRIKTFHKWMDNILARGKVKISKKDLDKISNCIERDGLGKMGKAPTLTLRHIRSYLQELDITNYNCNASYLLAMFSGVYPPQLSVSEYNKITIYYKKVINMYSKDPVGSNTPYCPYFIYKIIEELWPNDKVKLQLLNYIHLKKPNTLMKWDNEWRKICKKNSFIFRATDYTKFDDF